MEKDQHTEQVIGSTTVQPTVNNHRRSGKRKVVVACLLTFILTLLVAAGGMSAAYLYGRQTRTSDIDQKRETVVQEGEVIADVAKKLGPSVVSVLTQQQETVESVYFGSRTRTSQAAGTGLIIDASGLILTNKHVVPAGVSNVKVVLDNGDSYENVTVIGRDPLNDLAILKVAAPKDFQAAELGDSDGVRTGQKVIAIGNALGQFQNTVTSGIISGMGRPIEASDESGEASELLTNLFQTDAAINSGNSGGPLLDFSGRVIGINTAVAADAENIGFAIPVNEAKSIIASVKDTGKLSRPYIGVRYTMLTPDMATELGLKVQNGAYISTESGSIVADSPAAKSGLKSGDVITKVNTVELSSTVSLASAVGRFKTGEKVTLTVVREGKEQKIVITLSEAPDS